MLLVDMDGPTACNALRRRGFLKHIIGVSGNVLQDDVDRFMTMGATEVLAKPVSKPVISHIIHGESLLSQGMSTS